jgi:uncharacterized protein DUF6454
MGTFLGKTAAAVAAVTVLIATGAGATAAGARHRTDLASQLAQVDRSVTWTQVAKLRLTFPTYHPEGLVVTKDRYYLSSVEIIEPTVKYPAPVDGFDRTPGKGVGHLFVIDRSGNLIKDITLGHDIVYHPGGIDRQGHDILVPVAQYRPDSSAEIYAVDTRTLAVRKLFSANDHIGGIVYDASSGRYVGNTWGSRTFYEWTATGRLLRTWRNPENLVDFQDCQYVPAGKMACGGVTNLPTPQGGTYELGGIALIDLRRRTVVNEFPFQQWSTGGHVMTRNPLKLAADGHRITLWAAPDNGEEGVGTEIWTWSAITGT